jgi:outer membrane protein insertion porin family
MTGLLLPALAAAAAFAGEPVLSVRIQVAPSEAERLARYVEIQPGAPLEPAAVRKSVELLYATGEFADVVVEAAPGPGGVAVVFRPLPAPLLSAVRVEGDPVIDSGRIRRIARFQPGEPLWPARLDEAARDVALELAGDGYLEAQLTATTRRSPEGAEAVFHVSAGPRVRVARAVLEGVPEATAGPLRRRMRPRPGDVYRRERADEAAEEIRRALSRLGHWGAVVAVRAAYDPTAAVVALTFAAEPGPRVSLEVRGVSLSGGFRRKLEGILRDGGLKGDAFAEVTERLEAELRSRGHRSVSVSRHDELRPGDRRAIVYELDAGPKADVASVAVRGAPLAGLSDLLVTRPGAPLIDREVQADSRALRRALEDRGYRTADVEAELPEGGGMVPVVFRVTAGPRTLLTRVEVASPTPLPPAEAPRELRLRPGEPFRAVDLVRDRASLLAAYRNAGHLQADVTAREEFSSDGTEVDVRIEVTPGPQTRVDRIVIARLEQTRETVVRRELQLEEGEPLSPEKLLESQRRLSSLGVFQRVSIAELDPESVGRRSLVVSAVEAPLVTIAYGIGYAEREKLRGSVEVTRRNIGGLDRSITTFARASFRGNRFLTTFREPYLLGHRQDLFITGFREEEDRESFDFIRLGGLVQTARKLQARWNLIFRYAFQETDTFNLQVACEEIDRQFCSSTVSGPAASVVNDTRDDPLDPRRGHFFGADLQLSEKVLGGDSFFKGFVQIAAYHRLNARILLALSGRLGLARTFGLGEALRLPLPERFFAGGDYSLRGFKVDAVAPEGGNALLLGGAELRIDAGRYLSVAAFAEAGNVYPLVSDIDLRDLRYTAGFGLRYKTALGPLRIDWGYKLNRRPGEPPSRFHFAIGHAF